MASLGAPAPGPGHVPACFKDGVAERMLHAKQEAEFCSALLLTHSVVLGKSLVFSEFIFIGVVKGHITESGCPQHKINLTGLCLLTQQEV